MSLDVYLEAVRTTDVYWANITHNLGDMARAAGIYEALWRPEDLGVTQAGQLIPLLREGIAKMHADPEKFRAYDDPGSWGLFRNFLPFVAKYLAACEENPDAIVRVSR